MVTYVIIDFTFLGLQLTLQYLLPFMIGIVASGFSYNEEHLKWMYKWFAKLVFLVYVLFLIGYFFRGGYAPIPASTSMFVTVPISISMAFFFITKKKKYLMLSGLLFLVPVLQVTRMGIAAATVILILHFANKNIYMKALFGFLGVGIFLFIFNSKSFQEKTFYDGKGELSDLSFNYYDNVNINSSGRLSWKLLLQPGLKSAPIWGNGPRADNEYLKRITGIKAGEAHNDFLSVRYNYGYVGTALLYLGFLLTFISLHRVTKNYANVKYVFLLSTSVLTLFFSFLMFMYSDNILKYTIFFPNYFFAMIGIIYSLKKDEDLSLNTSL